MSVYGTDTPLDSAYSYYVRVTIAGIDCYSIGAESRAEAGALETVLADAKGVQETEVVEL
jgi:hypothetical protein